jgi:prolyl oligopeptidase
VASDWEFMKTWSPYQLVQEDADYPPVFFWANHRDDRVHPGHARKMAAKMLSQGHDVLYYEHLEGGHGAGAVNSQRAAIEALEFAFLWEHLGSGEGSETN